VDAAYLGLVLVYMRRNVTEELAAPILKVATKAIYQTNLICRVVAQFMCMQHIIQISRRFLLNFNRV